MECFGLYEDLSLFSGDLLVGSSSPLACELPFPGHDECANEPQMFPTSVDLFADELIKPSVKEPPTPVKDDWMEKKMELINLFSNPNVQVIIQHDGPDTIQTFDANYSASTESSSLGTDHGLFSTSAPSVGVEETTIVNETQAVVEGSLLDQLCGETHQSASELLHEMADYWSADLEQDTASSMDLPFVCSENEGIETVDGLASVLSVDELAAFGTPVLSPVSTEDIETVLSAGPSSPNGSMTSLNDGVVPEWYSSSDVSLSQSIKTAPSLSRSSSSGNSLSSLNEDSYDPVFESRHESRSGPIRSVRRGNRAKKPSPYYLTEDEDFDEGSKASKSSPKYSRTSKIADRAERKKQQNKDAALRYRMKKKEELSGVFDECDVLEKKNDQLKDKVDSMTREIQYLKDLLTEVYKAKGITPKGFKSK